MPTPAAPCRGRGPSAPATSTTRSAPPRPPPPHLGRSHQQWLHCAALRVRPQLRRARQQVVRACRVLRVCRTGPAPRQRCQGSAVARCCIHSRSCGIRCTAFVCVLLSSSVTSAMLCLHGARPASLAQAPPHGCALRAHSTCWQGGRLSQHAASLGAPAAERPALPGLLRWAHPWKVVYSVPAWPVSPAWMPAHSSRSPAGAHEPLPAALLRHSVLPWQTEAYGCPPGECASACAGDADAILPHLGTRLWLNKLRLPIEEPWQAWHSSTGAWSCGAAPLPSLCMAATRHSTEPLGRGPLV